MCCQNQHPEAEGQALVSPIVVQHGDRPWVGPRRVRELFAVSGVSPDLAQALLAKQVDVDLDLEFVLVDQMASSERELLTSKLSPFAQLTLQHLRYPAARAARS